MSKCGRLSFDANKETDDEWRIVDYQSDSLDARSAQAGQSFRDDAVRDDVRHVVAEKADLLALLQEEPEDNGAVAGYRNSEGSLIIDARF